MFLHLQDPKAQGITHVVVGEGGLASLPPQLQPGGARPTTSGAGRPSSAGAASQQLRRQYVNEHWLARCLAKQQLLPAEDYPPPDPAAEVPTPTAGGSEWAAAEPTSRAPWLLPAAISAAITAEHTAGNN